RGAWVDRPQGLLLVYRALLEVGGGSTESLRIVAAAVSMLIVIATVIVAVRICGTIEGIAAGLLLATFAASPFIESFTLSGELLAAFPAGLSLLAFTAYLRSRHLVWLAVAGLLTGCAVMIKQSAFDAGLAAVAFLLITERRRAYGAVIVVLAAFVPVAIAAWTAPHAQDWWNAFVAYRADGDSLLTGSPPAPPRPADRIAAGRGERARRSRVARGVRLALLAAPGPLVAGRRSDRRPRRRKLPLALLHPARGAAVDYRRRRAQGADGRAAAARPGRLWGRGARPPDVSPARRVLR